MYTLSSIFIQSTGRWTAACVTCVTYIKVCFDFYVVLVADDHNLFVQSKLSNCMGMNKYKCRYDTLIDRPLINSHMQVRCMQLS